MVMFWFQRQNARDTAVLIAELHALRQDRDRALFTNVDLLLENTALRDRLRSHGLIDEADEK